MIRDLGLRRALLLSFFLVSGLMLAAPGAAEALFSQPLHLTRQIDDPLAAAPVVLEEYFSGNRAVAVRGDRVSIADYEKGELLEIDRAANTFSRTPFERIAGARAKAAVARDAGTPWDVTPAPGRTVAATGAEVFTIRPPAGSRARVRSIEIALDPTRRLTREAFDVLTGAAFPNQPRASHGAIANAAARERLQPTAAVAAGAYALVLEEITTYEVAGETLVVRNSVTSVDAALPPDYLLAPLPGAKEVESPLVVRERLLEELDRLPAAPANGH
ncbi:MAG: hypothetical protein ACYC7A_06015 [Thermoanaerobaculia bacterium]